MDHLETIRHIGAKASEVLMQFFAERMDARAP
jgi:hypothetical protein